jgi:hypothetical protein
MPAPASRSPSLLSRLGLPLAGALGLAACGGNHNLGVGAPGSGSSAVLAGTFYKPATSTRQNDSAHVFGAVNSVGNGYFADLAGSSRAVFVFNSASSSGTLSGFYAAYAANGSNLGDGTTLQNGAVSGTVATQSGVTSASLKYANPASSLSTTATLVLDQPALAATPLANAQGSYSASLGAGAIASTALLNLIGSSYSLSLSAGGGATLATTSACGSFSGTASLDSSFDIYDLHLSGNCSGTTVVLDGQASYLPAGSASPLDGSTLGAANLVVELSDFLVNDSSPQYALVLIAPKSS